MKKNKTLFSFLFFQSILLMACSGSLSGDAIEGQVMEEGSKNPITDAIVVSLWSGYVSSLADSHNVCVHVQTTTTDNNGGYYFPAWRKSSEVGPVFKLKPVVTVYKPGYYWPENNLDKDYESYLTPAKGTSSERLAYLEQVVRATGCLQAGRSNQNLYQLYETLFKEAKPLVKTEEEQKTLAWIRWHAAYAWISTDSLLTQSEADKLIEEHLKEHLK